MGAGFAGLAAARDLAGQGHDVLVFEGRDRVGGRSLTGNVAGLPADMGGTFVGPTQNQVLALADELRVPTIPTYHDGRNVIHWRGAVRPYRGTIPRLSLAGLLDIARLRWQFERLARGVPISAPWDAPRAHELDGVSLGQWLRAVRATASSHDLMAIMARVTWGCEPEDVSMLHATRYVRAAGGLDRLLDVENGAQQDRFAGGTQQIADLAAAGLGNRVVLDARVRRIDRHGAGVTVTSDQGQAEAGFVIVAIPPAHRAAIEFDPPLPPQYLELTRHWPQGRLSKAYAAYSTPFWRANGFSGQALSDNGPVFITFDVSPHDDGRASSWVSSMPAHSTPCPPSSAAATRCGVSPRCSATKRSSRSTTPITVGAASNSRRAVPPPRCRPVPGPNTDGCCANRSGRFTGPARKPRMNGPVIWRAPSGPVGVRLPKSPHCYELIRRTAEFRVTDSARVRKWRFTS
ncbi:flavin containing amine oxidoreductase family protein [Mycobacterium kansasii 824]|nr:flavin containing amine oxidoreductase family protein [Mycobacterium kansasii 824]